MTPDQLAADLANVAETLSDAVIDAHQSAGALVLTGSQPPVDTGFLAASGEVLVDAGGWDVVYTAPYAGFVHAKDPFLTRSLTEQESALIDHYFNVIQSAVT